MTESPLDHACDRCGAPAGRPCRQPDGRKAVLHATRRGVLARTGAGNSLLDDETADSLEAHIATGTPIDIAAEAAGIHPATVYRWLAEADDPDPKNTRKRELRDRLTRARARAVQRNVQLIDEAAQGLYVVEQTERTLKDGSTERTIKLAPKDWRAAAFTLERQWPSHYGRRQQLAVSHEAGTGYRDTDEVSVAELADRLAEFRARRELADGEVVDAEIVEDP